MGNSNPSSKGRADILKSVFPMSVPPRSRIFTPANPHRIRKPTISEDYLLDVLLWTGRILETIHWPEHSFCNAVPYHT